jgi:uncharacterized protein (DUF305 family)
MTLDQQDDIDLAAPAGNRLRAVLLIIIVAALLVVAGAVGWAVRGGGGSPAFPKAGSIDAGFAQDMAIHHTQAVTMAGYERDNTTNSGLKVLATDIETEQQFQIGEMSGWLDTWNVSRNDPPPMRWMGPEHEQHVVNGLMPGMATPAQMNKLESLHGKALDIFFLQLMIHHHQGGIPMAQFAEQQASESYVRTFAGHVVATQNDEIVQMEQLLRQLGGSPLPPPET